MSKHQIIWFALGMLIAASPLQAKDKPCPSEAKNIRAKKSTYTAATYTVPDLTKKVAKELSKAIAKEPGLVAAKPDLQAKTFMVIFEPGQTTSKSILAALKKKAPDAAFSQEAAVEAVKTGCGKCPSRLSCPSKKK